MKKSPTPVAVLELAHIYGIYSVCTVDSHIALLRSKEKKKSEAGL